MLTLPKAVFAVLSQEMTTIRAEVRSGPRLSSIQVTAPPAPPLDSVAAMLASDEARVDRILAIAREVLSKRDIAADDELADHGGTSLSLVRIVAMTSRILNLDINPRDLDGMVTVRNLARVATHTGRPRAEQPRP